MYIFGTRGWSLPDTLDRLAACFQIYTIGKWKIRVYFMVFWQSKWKKQTLHKHVSFKCWTVDTCDGWKDDLFVCFFLVVLISGVWFKVPTTYKWNCGTPVKKTALWMGDWGYNPYKIYTWQAQFFWRSRVVNGSLFFGAMDGGHFLSFFYS